MPDGTVPRPPAATRSGTRTSRYTAPAEEGAIKAKVLALIGVDDPLVPPAQRDGFVAEMTAAKADWQLVLYGGVQHSFTNPAAAGANIPGIVYDAAAEKRSWQAMRDLFDEVLGPVEAAA